MMMEIEEDGPGAYTHTSLMYTWHGDQTSTCLHLVPEGVTKEQLDLGTLTRLCHYTLDGANTLPTCNAFVMVHYIPSDTTVHVTMLPVGDESHRKELDELMKGADGFGKVLEMLVDMCREHVGTQRADSVRVLYNSPSDVRESGKIAVVQELGVKVDPASVSGFVDAVSPPENEK